MLANLDRLARRMDELGLDGLVATTAENVYYLTGIASVGLEIFPHSGQCYAVVTRNRLAHPHFVATRCDLDQALDAAVGLDGAIGYGTFFREPPDGAPLTAREERLRTLWDGGPAPATPLDALVETLRRAGLETARIAVDEDGVPPFGFFDGLREALPAADVRTAAGLLRGVRKVKTPAETARVAAAAAVAEQAMLATAAIAKPGVTERDLVREFERTVAGAGGRPKFTCIKIGAAGVAGQSYPGSEKLRPGDHIWFDVGCVVDGYWSDIARVFSLGEPGPKVARYYDAMRAGVERAIAEARPGMTGKELFDITMEAVRESGVPHYRRNHTGHGIGVEIYDQVLIAPDNGHVIEEGTVVNIETPYYEFGFGAVQVEDPFVVRAEGNEVLTTLGRELTVLK
ncbi:Xaa-Pro peptidase family protein [Actinomycetes bacterium KLBMP 9797]